MVQWWRKSRELMANQSGLRRHAESLRPDPLQTASQFAKSGAFASERARKGML
jgi:hypothetical protein